MNQDIMVFFQEIYIYRFVGNKNIIGFSDFMLARKTLTDYTSLFSSYDFKKNDDVILSYFQDE